MKILIGADLVPTDVNIDMFSSGDVNGLLGDSLYEIWNSADVRLFNLEVPLIDEEYPIKKQGPNLIAPTKTINGIKNLNPTLVTLANNHILDQGIEGLISTKNLLNKYNIPSIGAGECLKEARQPFILKRKGITVGFYTCAEHEFTIATENSPGANPFDPLNSLDHVVDTKDKCDYLIVLYHGGKEHYRYPSPYLQKVCRKIVDKGADLVVCQHSHCVGSYEKYKDKTIVYGQGNFLFNSLDNEYWNNGLLLNITLNDRMDVAYVPIAKKNPGIHLTEDEYILASFYKRSEQIKQEGFITEKYQEFATENLKLYLRKFAGYGKWLSRIDRKLLNEKLLTRKYNIGDLLGIQNYVECEAHRELLLTGLKGEHKCEK